MTTHEDFLSFLCEHPDDQVTRRVFSDYLRDNDQWDRANLMGFVMTYRETDWPRLLFADFCDEEKDWGRAEFIRRQCGLHADDQLNEERVQWLLETEGSEWCWEACPEAPNWHPTIGVGLQCVAPVLELFFGRGFIEKARCPLATWQTLGKSLAVRCPLREVRLTDKRPRQRGEWWEWTLNPDTISAWIPWNVVLKKLPERLAGCLFPTEERAYQWLSERLLAVAHQPSSEADVAWA